MAGVKPKCVWKLGMRGRRSKHVLRHSSLIGCPRTITQLTLSEIIPFTNLSSWPDKKPENIKEHDKTGEKPRGL